MKDGSGRCHVFFVSAGGLSGTQQSMGTWKTSTFLGSVNWGVLSSGLRGSYVIVYRSENFLRRYQKARHLPYCHLEVHLGKFE